MDDSFEDIFEIFINQDLVGPDSGLSHTQDCVLINEPLWPAHSVEQMFHAHGVFIEPLADINIREIPELEDITMFSIGDETLNEAEMSMNIAHKPTHLSAKSVTDEMRYCPNGLVNIEQAWLWLARTLEISNHEPDADTPNVTDQPTLYHSQKQPICWLMAIAQKSASPAAAQVHLRVQDYLTFHPHYSVAMPDQVDIRVVGDVDWTLYEILAYLSSFHRVKQWSVRCWGNENKPSKVSAHISMIRGLDIDTAVGRGTISHFFPAQQRAQLRASWDDRDLTVLKWDRPTLIPHKYSETVNDYPLLGLALGVKKIPEGDDAGPITRLVQHCIRTGNVKAMISDVPRLLEETKISRRVLWRDGLHPDHAMRAKHSQAVQFFIKTQKSLK